MCVYVYIYVCVCVRVRLCVYMYIYIHTHTDPNMIIPCPLAGKPPRSAPTTRACGAPWPDATDNSIAKR